MIYTVFYILLVIILGEYIAKGAFKKLLLLKPLYIITTIFLLYIFILPLLTNGLGFISLVVLTLIILALGIANKIKIDYRQTGFTPVDFLILKEASSMSGALNKKNMAMMIIKFILILIILLGLAYIFRNSFTMEPLNTLLEIALIIGTILVFLILGPRFNYKLNVYKVGIVIFFLAYLRDPVKLKKDFKVDDDYDNDTDIVDIEFNEEKPDIIVIQSESFSDPYFLGKANFNTDPLPFFHGIKDEVYSFNMSTRAFGGGTVNTEFEILTGLSSSFFP